MAIAGDVGRLETYNTVMGSSAAMPCRRHRRPCPMVRESYHEAAACPDAEGHPPAAAAEVALHPDAGPGGRAGHEPQAMVSEHRGRIGRHVTDRRDALPLQHCCDGAGLSGGNYYQPSGSELTRANQQVAHVSQKKALRWPQ
jgi:hypothetical protein